MTEDAASWAALRSGADRWEPSPKPTVFVVPHPDDEVLMMGGLLRAALANSSSHRTVVLAVTDGEAAYTSLEADTLADIRRGEQHAAMRLLGSDLTSEVLRLSLPDSCVAGRASKVEDAICALTDPSWRIVSPWRHDHHPDHEACGRAAAAASKQTDCQLVEGLFWAWQHPPTDPPPRLRRLRLKEETADAKRAAIQAHRSQLSPQGSESQILSEADLAPLYWTSEFFIVSDKQT